MRTWSFVAQKGGVGKSLLAMHLAVLAEEKGEIVAILDIDPQTGAALVHRARRQRTYGVLCRARKGA